jgi:hypothetical protein
MPRCNPSRRDILALAGAALAAAACQPTENEEVELGGPPPAERVAPRRDGGSPGNVERLYTTGPDGVAYPVRWVRGGGGRELVLALDGEVEVRIDSVFGDDGRFAPDAVAFDEVRRLFGDEVVDELRTSLAAFT